LLTRSPVVGHFVLKVKSTADRARVWGACAPQQLAVSELRPPLEEVSSGILTQQWQQILNEQS
jgi:hypothetical protein